ncbi:MAG: hypothetical protein IKB13_03955 [Clostridia bacterium]|nr:hypothetical protein [Clostridia bacterium]
MCSQDRCIAYFDTEKEKLLADYPQKEQLTQDSFALVCDFVCSDFSGISEHKVFRAFLDMLKEIVENAFTCDAPKSYLHVFVKSLHTETVVDALALHMKTRKADVNDVLWALKQYIVHTQAASEAEYKKSVLMEVIEKMY